MQNRRLQQVTSIGPHLMNRFHLRVCIAVCLGFVAGAAIAADSPVGGLARDVARTGSDTSPAWKLSSALETAAKDSDASFATLGTFEAMRPVEGQESSWSAVGGARWRAESGRLVAEPGGLNSVMSHAVATYTVQPGGAGFYAIRDSYIHRAETVPDSVELRVFARRAGVPDAQQPEPAVLTTLAGGEVFDFDTFMGYLNVGDSICVAVGPDGDSKGDATEVDFDVVRTTLIPVSTFPDDRSNWTLMRDVAAGSPAERIVGKPAEFTDKLAAGSTGETLASFRVPHSGYYALHDAVASATGDQVQAKIYVGNEPTPRRVVTLNQLAASLNGNLGYIAKGDVIWVAFAGSGAVDFKGTIVEWAPRRAPIRVSRGDDGYLDVFASDAPATHINIPKDRWVEILATTEDATESIRAAFAKAKSLGGDGWAGVHLEKGATYVIGSDLNGGNLFEFRDMQRVVFDGNGATLLITSPEIQRKGFNLFTTSNGARNLVFADLTVAATHVPFTVGRITDVNPKSGNTQTVTVKLDPGAVDPIKEIVANGRTNAYVYDPIIPGRLGFGTWSHYPGFGDGPQIKATSEPGVFTHALTRTGSSIKVGDKWLIKNKGAGLTYLVTRGDSQDITLSNVTGKASGGGTLRFWATSGINVLGCHFEPDDQYWISSSADGIHGRGREGVWIEDTTLRGICEDIMNTYGRTMAVTPDDNPNDDVISLGVFENAVRSGKTPLRNLDTDDVRVGDRLVFFAPASGKVLGHAIVKNRDGGKVTLSKAVDGVVPWTGSNPREVTMVYSADSVGNFVVRDSKLMDSMRIGIYIKAQGGVVWGNNIEGLNAPGVFAANEPEWPEGPPATHLWVQGNTFSQNNYGYMSRNRDFLVVDPAEISVYTRKFRNPSEPDTHNAFVTHGQYANSHVKLIGNTFHDWRGMGISVRNAKNVVIEDNLFLKPADDLVMRDTLESDPAMSQDGIGRYTGLFLDSVNGARISGNRFVDLPKGDRTIARDQQVEHVFASDNAAAVSDEGDLDVAFSFSQWFGTSIGETAKTGSAEDKIELRGATYRTGRLGAGLAFDGKDARAVLAKSADVGKATQQLSVALWLRPEQGGGATQVVFGYGDADHGVVIAIDNGRLIGGVWKGGKGAWLDLGPAVSKLWQHVAIVYDGKTFRGLINASEVVSTIDNVPAQLAAIDFDASLGGAIGPIRMRDGIVARNASGYRGTIDELRIFARAIEADEAAYLALRRPSGTAR
jgi:hypothetical protein